MQTIIMVRESSLHKKNCEKIEMPHIINRHSIKRNLYDAIIFIHWKAVVANKKKTVNLIIEFV